MISRHKESQIKKEFWTTFGHYMKPVPFAGGEVNSWINYKTGIKHVAFKMDATSMVSSIAIEISHPEIKLQQLYYKHFQELKFLLPKNWNWQLTALNHETGRIVSCIAASIENVSIYNKADWPVIISFFKSHIIALDEFWSETKYAFEVLSLKPQ